VTRETGSPEFLMCLGFSCSVFPKIGQVQPAVIIVWACPRTWERALRQTVDVCQLFVSQRRNYYIHRDVNETIASLRERTLSTSQGVAANAKPSARQASCFKISVGPTKGTSLTIPH